MGKVKYSPEMKERQRKSCLWSDMWSERELIIFKRPVHINIQIKAPHILR